MQRPRQRLVLHRASVLQITLHVKPDFVGTRFNGREQLLGSIFYTDALGDGDGKALREQMANSGAVLRILQQRPDGESGQRRGRGQGGLQEKIPPLRKRHGPVCVYGECSGFEGGPRAIQSPRVAAVELSQRESRRPNQLMDDARCAALHGQARVSGQHVFAERLP